jgi:GNAT superfamily N-acetyltransferase
MNDLRIVRQEAQTVTANLEQIADIYDEVYAEPPYNGGPLFTRDAFLTRTRSQIAAEGFAFVAATSDAGIVGFCFGFSLGRRWWGGESSQPPTNVANATKYAVIELVMRRPFRNSGAGRKLLGELLRDRREEYATLLSVPGAAARGIYERWGWHKAGTVQPNPDAPVMDAMVLPLPDHRRLA